mgnify:CR=1 FL=1
MADRHLHIITDCGPGMGTGHLQRMMLLAWYLDQYGPCTVSLQVLRPCKDMPGEILPLVSDSIHPGTDIIVRDMRDSTADEIRTLQQHAPVIVIDDEGAGAELASERVYILPRPGLTAGENTFPPFFLYGYGFYTGMKAGSEPPRRDIDLSLYTGNSEDHPYTEKTLSLLPGDLNIALLYGDKQDIYTSLLTRSRCVMSHFGILLYEAHLCGCHLLSVNPTEYHSHLADIAPLPVHNFGSIDTIQSDPIEKLLHQLLSSQEKPPPTPAGIVQKVHENLVSFSRWLISLPFYR